VVALNFTLQFIAPEQRLALLGAHSPVAAARRCADPLGKAALQRPEEHALLTDLHIAFKRANGYSELEIAQKRSAIENVMKPDSLEEHRERLLAAGFSKVVPWFQCLNFASLIALP
jgi:tRNA (cmo5U34)-methyltransferase